MRQYKETSLNLSETEKNGQFGSFEKNPKKLNFSTSFWIFCFILELIMNFSNSHQFEKLTISSLKLSKNAKNCFWQEFKEIEFSNIFSKFFLHFWIYVEFLKLPWIWKIDNLEPKIVKKCQMCQFGSFDKNSKKFNSKHDFEFSSEFLN